MMTQEYRKQWDRLIILPAIVLFIQNMPWFAARLRMRVLVPLMVIYIVYMVMNNKRNIGTDHKEHAASVRMLASSCLFFLTYMLVEIFYYHEFSSGWLICSTFGLFYMWVFTRLALENKVMEIKILTLVTLTALFIGGYTSQSYLATEENQNIVRSITGGTASDMDVNAAVYAGVGGYGFVYSVGMLAPALFYAGLRSKSLIRWFFWMCGCFLMLNAYRAGFSILMATIVLGLTCYTLSFGIRTTVGYRLTAMFLVMFVLLVTLNPQVATFMVSPLLSIANSLGNDNYIFRLTSVADSITGSGDDYAVYRTGMMWKSWGAFLQSPIYGVSEASQLIGGHSFFFDYLAMGGLVAFLPYPFFIYFYIKYLRLVVYPLSRSARVLIETYLFMFIFCTFMNPLNSATVWASFFLILPGISLFFFDSRLNGKKELLNLRGHGYASRTY
jgi:hypothetical protein